MMNNQNTHGYLLKLYIPKAITKRIKIVKSQKGTDKYHSKANNNNVKTSVTFKKYTTPQIWSRNLAILVLSFRPESDDNNFYLQILVGVIMSKLRQNAELKKSISY